MSSRLTSRNSTLRLAAVSLLAVMAGLLFTPSGAVFAYQAAGEGAAPADAAAAAPAAAPAAEPAAGGGDSGGGAKQTTMLEMIAGGLGWVWGTIFLLLSFIMVAVIMMNVLQLRRDNLLPASFIELFEQKLQTKDYQGAYDTARADDSFVSRVLAAGLGRLNRGYEEAIEGMQEVGEEETMAMEHKISYLALIGSVAPMLGLTGTVQGMIASFSKIAGAETAPKPKELAEGISTALVTTLAGLIVAIPAMIAYSLLKNRMNRLVLETGVVSEGLMSRFNRKPGAGGAAAPAQKAE
ncbi:MAG: MotA/TolQ/ExbB proton channel family protein [Planctomycetaceae bacterium]